MYIYILYVSGIYLLIGNHLEVVWYKYTHTYIYIYVYIYIYMFIYIYICYIHIYIHICIWTYDHTPTSQYIYIHICILSAIRMGHCLGFVNIYIYIYVIYIYVSTCTIEVMNPTSDFCLRFPLLSALQEVAPINWLIKCLPD